MTKREATAAAHTSRSSASMHGWSRPSTSLGYEEPTPIQREAIPPLLAGRDLLGQAATGTGKTAAFALPLLQRLERREGGRAGATRRRSILVPTRELAMQVAEAVHTYGRELGDQRAAGLRRRSRWSSRSARSSAASTSSSRRRAARSITSAGARSSLDVA